MGAIRMAGIYRINRHVATVGAGEAASSLVIPANRFSFAYIL